MLGERREGLKLSSVPPTVVMMVGLQGSGKTTTAAKLARKLKLEGRAGRASSPPTSIAPPPSTSSRRSASSSTSRSTPSATTQDVVKIARNGIEQSRARAATAW